jgi:hypothetical protein
MTPKISEKPEAKRKRIAPYEMAFNMFSKTMFMKRSDPLLQDSFAGAG